MSSKYGFKINFVFLHGDKSIYLLVNDRSINLNIVVKYLIMVLEDKYLSSSYIKYKITRRLFKDLISSACCSRKKKLFLAVCN